MEFARYIIRKNPTSTREDSWRILVGYADNQMGDEFELSFSFGPLHFPA